VVFSSIDYKYDVIVFCYSNFKIKRNNVDGRTRIISYLNNGLVKSQAEFCREIGFMRQNIRKVKAGAAHFSLEHLAMICKVL
jgi:hypothetical protein